MSCWINNENGLAASIQCFFPIKFRRTSICCVAKKPTYWRLMVTVCKAEIELAKATFSRSCFPKRIWFDRQFESRGLVVCFFRSFPRRTRICKGTLGHYECKKKIRKNRYGIMSGCPDALYYLPESFGRTSDLLQYVADRDYHYAWNT